MISESPHITFDFADTRIPPIDQASVRQWLVQVAKDEGQVLDYLGYVFCSDERLLAINVEYLQHDYYTDIITFSFSSSSIDGECYISVDRVAENAHEFNQPYLHEMLRVMVHGLLHLCGHDDQLPDQQLYMRNLENYYLSRYVKTV